MGRRKAKVKLPDWANKLWQELGSPDLEDIDTVHTGNLLKRRHGLRRDDLIEVMLDARALPKGEESWLRGRLLSSGKTTIEILGSDGRHHYLARDVIVQVILVAHTRPAYIDDEELLSFERADQKRRNNLHEKAEKETSGTGDSHLWG
jgi:hypothetical protein